ncbi:hypothetical protein W03_09920 [Nitrosomonas sp. PY1]|uniref:phage head-tail joining protein n=1 Tax=Nitrosomonas sp. PY1 TaxID=1803906 RepID=UPI001FC7CA4E|nr:hypothetical protein [Nitrosomonas sp. PY1]GKS68988.1 hypothetical protein W03_09920 [Nitrosomonas sp. PY1]
MSFTITQLEAIERAIASGELTIIGANGRQVTYRSMTDLLKARDLIKKGLEETGSVKKKKFSFIKFGNR